MVELTRLHAPIIALIGGRPVAFLDIPLHGNTGDLLILRGTLAFLKRNGVRIRQISSVYNYREIPDPETVILFQGGGNFGDLYPGIQKFREKIILAYPENRIIFLPQSVCYQSAEEQRKSAEILCAHADLHIFIRDRKSFCIAKEMARSVYLVPDMAHHLYPVRFRARAGRRPLHLIRTDKEATRWKTDGQSSESTDWPTINDRFEVKISFMRRIMKSAKRRKFSDLLNNAISYSWVFLAGCIIARAIQIFRGASLVTTDRLHAFLLASLMDIETRVYDNSYGKLSSYIETWMPDSGFLTMAENPAAKNNTWRKSTPSRRKPIAIRRLKL